MQVFQQNILLHHLYVYLHVFFIYIYIKIVYLVLSQVYFDCSFYHIHLYERFTSLLF